ncbi:DsbA family protein [Coleofasciculus sp. FACHB-SPT9]|uniref:DsbA family protein n=1 Tax=Cyanophyceae TaxID=3028117 RepID=UPI00168653F6|nr:DsbA family protein [Coleofasciculus sp. FACHB-SPT9]MBD1889848.1 DsbA family protein [Coleofasciculus sp. FACHB-SPT9]
MSQANEGNRLSVPPSERDRIQGSLDAPVVLVKYGDYQSPDCSETHRMIKVIQQQLGNRLGFVFRHFPQVSIHPQAQKAAEAAEAAAAQGKFWQMHDTLFQHQQSLDNGYLVEYANELGLDMPQFLQAMWRHVYADRVTEDVESGLRSGVTTTPTLFINGIRYSDAWNVESLLAAIARIESS